MSDRSTWSLGEPRRLLLDGPVSDLQVRVVGGSVDIVGTDSPAGGGARLELTAIDGPPLSVTHHQGTLTVAYDDLPWKDLLTWLDGRGWRRSVRLSLTVPAGTNASVGVIGAGAVVSGLTGRTELRGVHGDTTLVGLSGPVRADTVTGRVEAQAVTGELRFTSVSGDLTVLEGAGPRIRAESVGGSLTLDLAPGARGADLGLTTVSGAIAVRLPHPADAEVRASTTGGEVSCAFEELRVSGQWGGRRISGTLGSGTGRLKATTVTGGIALLRRPPAEGDEVAHGSEGKVL
ncbi:DUF4097 family beta strand repeat-containing protein [Streptomyces palmae]|uniref:Adhesin domain-containing protein n=1 Tax=Streptomyces palmae TaxID=1701085 RepID=A0A4Z0H9Y3_9ACTN|nr:DUF4097 family beta strand repeat-containing protein [Streptomyces palmae]TGB14689.1 hypothetical protein E4099_08060 [Streptomyces palmae]